MQICVFCRWSPNENEDDSCGEETDDAYWYMGATECFRANAAFSLYGVLQGEDDVGCQKSTFINSFFTTTGVEAFTSSMYSAGLSISSNTDDGNGGGISSICTYEGGGDDDDGGQVSHNSKNYNGATSYGLGCINKVFVEQSFRGANCNANNAIKITNRLYSFNQELKQAHCIPIYASSYSGDDDGNQEHKDDNEGAVQLLYNSKACSVRDFPDHCPDPYGKLHAYARKDAKAVARATDPRKERIKTVSSWILISLGILLMVTALLVFLRRSKLTQRRNGETRRFKKRDKQKKKKKEQPSGSDEKKRRLGFLRRERAHV